MVALIIHPQVNRDSKLPKQLEEHILDLRKMNPTPVVGVTVMRTHLPSVRQASGPRDNDRKFEKP
jgi:hypothetical protein